MSNDDNTDDAAEADRHEDRLFAPMTDHNDTIETVEASATWQDFDDAEAN